MSENFIRLGLWFFLVSAVVSWAGANAKRWAPMTVLSRWLLATAVSLVGFFSFAAAAYLGGM